MAVLQSPTTDHALVSSALAQLRVTGGTAIGDALQTALRDAGLAFPGGRQAAAGGDLAAVGWRLGRRLGSDHGRPAGGREAHPDLTVELGTPHGTVTEKRGSKTITVPVPPNPAQLAEIARVSHGQAFTARTAKGLDAIYTRSALSSDTRRSSTR